MENRIANFMRAQPAIDDMALKLGIMPRAYTNADVRLFFLKAADEIDRLESENAQMRAALSAHEQAQQRECGKCPVPATSNR